MKRIYKYVALLLIVIFMLGCQPTPTQEIIVNRGDNLAEKKILYPDSSDITPLSCPQKWNETFTVHDGMDVHFEADVQIGESNSHPVYTIERLGIDSDYTCRVVNAVFQNITGLREQSISYEELLEDYLAIQRGVFSGFDDNGEAIWSTYEGQEKDAASIKEQIENTDITATYRAFDKSAFEVGNEWTPYAVRRADDSIAYFNCTTRNGGMIWCYTARNCNIQKENWVLQGDAIPGEDAHSLEAVKISEEHATSVAEALFARLGLENMQLSRAEKARSLDDWEEISEGWFLEYAPTTEGTCGFSLRYYTSSGILRAEQNSYTMPWMPETVEIYVTENGIESFSISNPYCIVNTANTNVQLLPFDEVQDRIKNAFRFGLSWTEGLDVGAKEIVVTKLILTTGIMQIKNQSDEAFLIPIWAVVYTTDSEKELHFDQSVLLINALDGSIIVQ